MPSRPSRAIPIKNPVDGTQIVVQRNAEPYDQEWPPIANPPAPIPRPPTPTPPSKPASGSSSRKASSPRKGPSVLKSTLDVYARAYVPEAYRIVNEFAPSSTYRAPNPRAIDYVSYVQSFGASSYLQNRPFFENARYTCLDRAPAYFETKEFFRYESELSISEQYERHFECLIGREFAHHHVEHKLHSLYNEKLQPYPNSNDLYTLEWPGVREETPFIQAGDSIQLRQLTPLDESMRLASMEHWIKTVGRPHLNSGRLDTPSPLPPGWTGSLYVARVHTVIRRQEAVVLYAPHLSGNMEFNVILPVPKKPYETRLNAVAHFGRSLGNGIPNGTSQAPSSKPWARKILFPEPDDGVWQTKLDPWTSKRKWFDDRLNFEQQ